MAVRSSVKLLLRLSRISSAGERCWRVVAGGSPSCMLLLYSKMRSMTSCFPNKITQNKDQNLHPIVQANPSPNPLHTHSPPAPGIALNASPGAGVKAGPEPAKGHPEGLALTPARTAPHCHSREQGEETQDQTRAVKRIDEIAP